MVIDKIELFERLDGNQALIKMLLNKFIGDNANLIESTETMLAHDNFSELALYFHTIKGSAANLSMHVLAEKAQQMEIAAKKNVPPNPKLLTEIKQALDDVVEASKSL